MPTYEYRCTKCGNKLEIMQKMSDIPLKRCENCGNDTLLRGPGGGLGFMLQGEGWYKRGEAPKECCPCGKTEGTCQSVPKTV